MSECSHENILQQCSMEALSFPTRWRGNIQWKKMSGDDPFNSKSRKFLDSPMESPQLRHSETWELEVCPTTLFSSCKRSGYSVVVSHQCTGCLYHLIYHARACSMLTRESWSDSQVLVQDNKGPETHKVFPESRTDLKTTQNRDAFLRGKSSLPSRNSYSFYISEDVYCLIWALTQNDFRNWPFSNGALRKTTITPW